MSISIADKATRGSISILESKEGLKSSSSLTYWTIIDATFYADDEIRPWSYPDDGYIPSEQPKLYISSTGTTSGLTFSKYLNEYEWHSLSNYNGKLIGIEAPNCEVATESNVTRYYGDFDLTNDTFLSKGTTSNVSSISTKKNKYSGYIYKGYYVSNCYSLAIQGQQNNGVTSTSAVCDTLTYFYPYVVFFYEKGGTPTNWQDPKEISGIAQGLTRTDLDSETLPGYQAGYVWATMPEDFNNTTYGLWAYFTDLPANTEYWYGYTNTPSLNGFFDTSYIQSAGPGTAIEDCIDKTGLQSYSLGSPQTSSSGTMTLYTPASSSTNDTITFYFAFPFTEQTRSFNVKLQIKYKCVLILNSNGGAWESTSNINRATIYWVNGKSTNISTLTYPTYFATLTRSNYLFKGYNASSTAKLPQIRKSAQTFSSFAGEKTYYAVWWPEFSWTNYDYTEANELAGYIRDIFSLSEQQLPKLSYGSVVKTDWYNTIMEKLGGSKITSGAVITKKQLDDLLTAYKNY